MATYMRVNPDSDPASGALTGANYRLPADADVGLLAGQLSDLLAGNAGGLTVTFEAGTDDAPAGGMVFLNGSQIHSVILVNLPD